jgi:alpha-beta hydrolase superfamily lysophospholipase
MKAAHLHAGTPERVPVASRRTAEKQHANSPAAQTPLWQAHYEVGKFPTEVIGVQATQTPAAQLLVVPGNPGYAGFYTDFMQQLHGAMGGTADVLAVSHVGHDAEDISRGAVWGLGCQVQHKAALVRELTSPGQPPLVILAHSIGAYIMLQVCARVESRQKKPYRTGYLLPVCICSSWHDSACCVLLC